MTPTTRIHGEMRAPGKKLYQNKAATMLSKIFLVCSCELVRLLIPSFFSILFSYHFKWLNNQTTNSQKFKLLSTLILCWQTRSSQDHRLHAEILKLWGRSTSMTILKSFDRQIRRLYTSKSKFSLERESLLKLTVLSAIQCSKSRSTDLSTSEPMVSTALNTRMSFTKPDRIHSFCVAIATILTRITIGERSSSPALTAREKFE